MRQVKIIVGLVACGVLFGSPYRMAAQESIPVIAVFGIEDKSKILSSQDRDSLTAYLGTKLAEGGRYRLIPENDLRRVLREQKKDSHRACYDQQCQIEIGRELAAQLTLNTRISRLGSNCLLTATIYDLGSAASENTATARGGCQVNQVLKSIESLVEALRGEKKVVVKPQPPPKPTVLPPTRPAPKRPSGFMVLLREAGIITLYTFGGLSSVAGIALIGVGLGTDDKDFLYGGVPALLGGVGLILLAYWITPDDDDQALLPGSGSSPFAIVPGPGSISLIGRF